MTNYSVIIPHFTKKGTEMLCRAISSVPIRDDIEVIVVDNSLKPISSELFKKNKMVSIYYSDNKRGAGGARNVGLTKAKGKWLLFMDADDFFTEKAFESFDRYKDSEYDIIFFRPTSCDSDTYKLSDRHYAVCTEIDGYMKTGDEYGLRCRDFDVPWAKMIRREMVEANNICFDEVPASNDVMFSLKTGLAAREITVSPDTVYCVTKSLESITNTVSLRNLESVFEVKIRKNQLLKENGLPRASSVANTIRKSAGYGIKPFLAFLWRAISTGNLLVGYNRWPETVLRICKNRLASRKENQEH